MTICIASIYNDSGVICAADKMMTTSGGVVTTHEVNENSKIVKLNKNAVAMIAGNINNAAAILEELSRKSANKKTIKDLADEARSIYNSQLKKAIEDNILSRWGMSLPQFMKQQTSLEQSLSQKLNDLIGQANFEVEILIAGTDASGPHIYQIKNPGVLDCLDVIGFACIGSGSQHATLSMIESKYHRKMVKGIAALNTIKAKKRAEFDPGVGEFTSFAIVDSKGIKSLEDEAIKNSSTQTIQLKISMML